MRGRRRDPAGPLQRPLQQRSIVRIRAVLDLEKRLGFDEVEQAMRTSRLSHPIFCLFLLIFSSAPIRGHRAKRKARQSMCKTDAR